MPDADNSTESGRPVGADSTEESRSRWRPSLWLWPVPAIGLATIAGTLYGPTGAIVTGEALAALALTSGILLFSRDRWLTFGLAVVLVVSLTALAGSIWLSQSDRKGGPRTAASIPAASPQTPVDWQWRRITQAMVDAADLRGADLNGANLDGLQLPHKKLDGVQANGASFRGSQMQHVSLRGASLRGACLEGANLTGADLTGADFTGANVAGVTVSRHAEKAALAWPGAHSVPSVACS